MIIRDIMGHKYRKRLSKNSTRHPGRELLKVTRLRENLLAPVYRVGGHFMPWSKVSNNVINFNFFTSFVHRASYP